MSIVDLTDNIAEIADALHLLAVIHEDEEIPQRWVDRVTEGREQLAGVLREWGDVVFAEEDG